jgi:hypothetical protein
MVTKNEYPLFPELTEQGKVEAQELIGKFKKELIKASKGIIENITQEFYCDVVPYVESDSWTNFRNELMDGYKNYDNRKIQGEYDFKEIRKQIFEQFKDEIIKDLDQDNLKEIEKLKRHIKILQESRH